MQNVYSIVKYDWLNRIESSIGEDYLLIKRKPSEIPHSIDYELLKICGNSDSDGPNSKVYYNIKNEAKRNKAVSFLNSCGWELE